MKRIATLVLLTLICVMGYAQTIDMALEKEMGQRLDDEKINVFVIMKQQYDQEKLSRRADVFTTRAERREFVVNELKQFAEASQYDIRQSLAEMEENDMVSTPRVLPSAFQPTNKPSKHWPNVRMSKPSALTRGCV